MLFIGIFEYEFGSLVKSTRLVCCSGGGSLQCVRFLHHKDILVHTWMVHSLLEYYSVCVLIQVILTCLCVDVWCNGMAHVSCSMCAVEGWGHCYDQYSSWSSRGLYWKVFCVCVFVFFVELLDSTPIAVQFSVALGHLSAQPEASTCMHIVGCMYVDVLIISPHVSV